METTWETIKPDIVSVSDAVDAAELLDMAEPVRERWEEAEGGDDGGEAKVGADGWPLAGVSIQRSQSPTCLM